MPSGLYARLCHAFLVYLSSFLMISRRQIISRSAGPIYAVFTSNESFLAVDDRSGHLFFDISRDVATATDFVQKNGKLSTFVALHSETVWDIATSMGALTAEMMPVYCVKMFLKFGPVTPELTGLI